MVSVKNSPNLSGLYAVSEMTARVKEETFRRWAERAALKSLTSDVQTCTATKGTQSTFFIHVLVIGGPHPRDSEGISTHSTLFTVMTDHLLTDNFRWRASAPAVQHDTTINSSVPDGSTGAPHSHLLFELCGAAERNGRVNIPMHELISIQHYTVNGGHLSRTFNWEQNKMLTHIWSWSC